MLKKILRSIFSKLVILNLIIILIISMIGLLSLNFYLDNYTLHNIEITVPDLRNFTVNEVKPLLENRKLRYNVIDSNYEKPNLPEIKELMLIPLTSFDSPKTTT